MAWLSLLLVAGVAFAQTGDAMRGSAAVGPLGAVSASRVLGESAVRMRLLNDNQSDSPYIKGKARFLSGNEMRQITGAHAAINADAATIQAGMPMWQGQFEFLGATFPFRMIGTDPAKGSKTSNIPVMLIPLSFSYADGTNLSAAKNACGDTEPVAKRILQSPIFQNFSYTLGPTFVGNTQYIDAFQRANFWNHVSHNAPDYHVLLNPKLGAVAAINPEAAPTAQGPCVLKSGTVNTGRIATVDIGVLDQQVLNIIGSMNIPPNVLPVFVMYNVFATVGGGCCVLGYHNVIFPNLQQYVVASYDDPGLFNVPIEDIHPLSHELGEWLNDPTARNWVPAWGNVGQVSGCANTLEVGDPVTGIASQVTMNGFTYHPEDLVFWSWFTRATPARSVNNQYTFLNTFPRPQSVCQP